MGENTATAPGQSTSASRRLPGSGRVLVIEDEPSLRETLEVLVAIEGCEVRTAGDGESALALMKGWVPDLILLDLTLPGISGGDFISAYHGTPGPHAPIIVMTGWTMDDIQARALGAAGFIPKPFDITELLDAVANFAPCGES